MASVAASLLPADWWVVPELGRMLGLEYVNLFGASNLSNFLILNSELNSGRVSRLLVCMTLWLSQPANWASVSTQQGAASSECDGWGFNSRLSSHMSIDSCA